MLKTVLIVFSLTANTSNMEVRQEYTSMNNCLQAFHEMRFNSKIAKVGFCVNEEETVYRLKHRK